MREQQSSLSYDEADVQQVIRWEWKGAWHTCYIVNGKQIYPVDVAVKRFLNTGKKGSNFMLVGGTQVNIDKQETDQLIEFQFYIVFFLRDVQAFSLN